MPAITATSKSVRTLCDVLGLCFELHLELVGATPKGDKGFGSWIIGALVNEDCIPINI